MRQKKTSRRRVEVQVEANSSPRGGWDICIRDAAGHLSDTTCVSRNNVAFKATQEAARVLGVPEGRIKINRVVYV
ncbi:hypothetical protein TIN4_105 [Tsukamurella phage TIN4]|uniref:Uncharacterized protein n=2 Tax=Tinduovirus TIN3 TaxID=1982571 RepID=A0A0K0N5Y8_9CAUD|nr:hypothetical protein AVT54_gp020 [Tsukamurella phage TIN3]YP_009604235.1 hypothetical protein FDH87_gp020 [Tsukamurella phage TIN4]AKJ71902.1 hypothetical protein TIN3_105 [Tsukamurella phage TIN3]AKJ72011.1 hypothetical protein TIN4_105 [Tsukamurella phage TIN4]